MIEIDLNDEDMQLIDGGSGCSEFWGGVAVGLGIGAVLASETVVGGAGLGIAALGAKFIQVVAC
jgi:hypothetical protein